jgi:hypothetical protein
MKLSEDQIALIRKVVIAKGIDYIDLQDELVDHLANAVTARLEENSSLSFQKVLHQECNKFGPFGFKKILRKRERYLINRSFKTCLRLLLDYFTIPKIVFSIVLYWFYFQLMLSVDSGLIMQVAKVLSVVLILANLLIYWKNLFSFGAKYLIVSVYRHALLIMAYIIFIIPLKEVSAESSPLFSAAILLLFSITVLISSSITHNLKIYFHKEYV